jgi:hypothetical protein
LKNIQVLRAGIIEHSKVSEIMRVMQQKRINDEIIDSIILVEHPEIVTIGPKASREGVSVSDDPKQTISGCSTRIMLSIISSLILFCCITRIISETLECSIIPALRTWIFFK